MDKKCDKIKKETKLFTREKVNPFVLKLSKGVVHFAVGTCQSIDPLM